MWNLEMDKRIDSEHPTRVKAVIREYNSGRYGRMGEYIAIVEPQYFKNGNIKKSGFTVIETIEQIKKGYGYGNCKHSEVIHDILEIIK